MEVGRFMHLMKTKSHFATAEIETSNMRRLHARSRYHSSSLYLVLWICLWHCRTSTMAFVPSKTMLPAKTMTPSTILLRLPPLRDAVRKESAAANGEGREQEEEKDPLMMQRADENNYDSVTPASDASETKAVESDTVKPSSDAWETMQLWKEDILFSVNDTFVDSLIS
jgi:hypothetical protein